MNRENQWSTWRNGRLVEVARYTERHQLGMIRVPVATLDPDLNRTALQDAEEIVRSHNERGELLAALERLILHFPATQDPSDKIALADARAVLEWCKGGAK